MKQLTAILAGFIFGFGLTLSGMMNPQKVLGFLDIAGNWDPSLVFVMGGAVVVNFFGFRWGTSRPAPWFAEQFRIPNRQDFDKPLVLGAGMFGLGWGLVGLCPGPALVSLTSAPGQVLLFVVAMLVGMSLARAITPQRPAANAKVESAV